MSSIHDTLKAELAQRDKVLRTELKAVAEEYAADLQEKHSRVVRDWKHRPPIKYQTFVGKNSILTEGWAAGVNSKFYKWVNKGTKPHLIKPKDPNGFLVFQTGYSARTKPIGKFNVGTGKKFGAWRRVKVVNHPGTKARKFTETFDNEVFPLLDNAISDTIRRVLRQGR